MVHVFLAGHPQQRHPAGRVLRHPTIPRAPAIHRAVAQRNVGHIFSTDHDHSIPRGPEQHIGQHRCGEIAHGTEAVVAGADFSVHIHPGADAPLGVPRNLRREGRPSDILFPRPPRHPGRRPVRPRDPAPTAVGNQPTAVVIDNAAKGLVTHPSPPHICVGPVAIGVGRPALLDVRSPTRAATCNVDPISVRSQGIIEKAKALLPQGLLRGNRRSRHA